MMIQVFEEMLRQMSVHFTVNQIVKVLYTGGHLIIPRVFMLYMENGEYWFVQDIENEKTVLFGLHKYPPPIPSVSELPWVRGKVPAIVWNPEDLNDYVKANGGGESLSMPLHGDDSDRSN